MSDAPVNILVGSGDATVAVAVAAVAAVVAEPARIPEARAMDFVARLGVLRAVVERGSISAAVDAA